MFKNILFLGLVMLLLFGVCEIVCRAFGYHPMDTEFKPVMASEKLGWQLKPGYDHPWQDLEWSIPYHTNALGFRDDEHALTKHGGELRLITLGGSFAEGYGVSQEDMWQTQLEHEHIAKKSVEMINLGVRGYNILQEYRQYREMGSRFQHDGVIQIISESVFSSKGEALIDSIGQSRPGFKIVEGRIEFETTSLMTSPRASQAFRLTQSVKKLVYRSAFCVWVRRKWEQLCWKWVSARRFWERTLLKSSGMSLNANNTEYARLYPEAIRLAYHDLGSEASLNNRLFLVVWVSAQAIPKALTDILQESKIDWVQVSLNPNEHFRYDSHPNKLGHRKIAQAVHDYLAMKKVL